MRRYPAANPLGSTKTLSDGETLSLSNMNRARTDLLRPYSYHGAGKIDLPSDHGGVPHEGNRGSSRPGSNLYHRSECTPDRKGRACRLILERYRRQAVGSTRSYLESYSIRFKRGKSRCASCSLFTGLADGHGKRMEAKRGRHGSRSVLLRLRVPARDRRLL